MKTIFKAYDLVPESKIDDLVKIHSNSYDDIIFKVRRCNCHGSLGWPHPNWKNVGWCGPHMSPVQNCSGKKIENKIGDRVFYKKEGWAHDGYKS